MKHSLIELSDPRLLEPTLFEQPHSVYHTPTFCRSMALAHDQYIQYYVGSDQQNKIVLPLVNRPFNDCYDICNPYGYSGFFGSMINAVQFDGWCQFMKEQACVCAYVLLHPLFSSLSDDLLQRPEISIAHTAYVLDLQLSLEELHKNLSTNHKRNLKKIKNENIVLSTDKMKLIPAFIKLYEKFLMRQSMSAVYQFGKKALDEILKREDALLIGAISNEKVEAVSVYLYNQYCADFFLNASSIDGRQFSRAIMWHAIEILKSKNCPFLNLGGGIREGDGVGEHKKQFGGSASPAKVLKIIFDHNKFDALCHAKNISVAHTNYFPPYRYD